MKNENSHEWIKIEDDICTIGISSNAKDELGEITNIMLPKIHQKVKKDQTICILETVKSAIEIESPVSGIVIEINEKLKKNLNDLNEHPETTGWLFKIKASSLKELERLK